ncbi:MAG: DUF1415 family protein [Polyangiaceae bacterium]
MNATSAEVTTAPNDDAFTREVIRVYRRYQLEIVEACGLCPWAERARVEQKCREWVLLETDRSVNASSLAALGEVFADDNIEIAFLIYPRLKATRPEFDRFVARVRDADSRRHPLGKIPFMFAGFHPEAAAELSDPERLIPFLRRTPDPTIQLVRSSVVDKIRGKTPQGTQFFDASTLLSDLEKPQPAIRDKIALANLETVKKMGADDLRKKLDDIQRDRNESYQRFES